MKAGHIFLGDHPDSIRTLLSCAQRVPTSLTHGVTEPLWTWRHVPISSVQAPGTGHCTLNAARTLATHVSVPALAGSLWLAPQSLADGETLAHVSSKLQGLL